MKTLSQPLSLSGQPSATGFNFRRSLAAFRAAVCFGAVALTLPLLTNVARAGSVTNLINVQYRGSATNPNSAPAGGQGTTYSGAAVVGSAGDTWNQEQIGYYYQSPNPFFSGVALVNSSNSASGLTLTLGFNGSNPIQGANLVGTATDVATTNLTGAAIYIFSVNGAGTPSFTTTHTIGGLSSYAGATANLIVYAAAPSAQAEQIAITGGASGGNSGSTLSTSSTDRKISGGAGDAYQIFTNVTLTGGNLVFTVGNSTAANFSNAGYVNGFQLQIIQTVLDPAITTQPKSTATATNGPAKFSVTASGTAPFSYQWQATNSATGGFTNVPNAGVFSGANTNTLTITGATANNALAYQVIVSNVNGSITSSPASLTLVPSGTTSLYIANNSFELPYTGSQHIYCSGTAGTYTYVTSWINVVTAGYWDINVPSGVTNADGAQVLESYDVGSGLQGYIYQELTNAWVPGAVYTMTVRAGQPSGGNPPNTGNTVSIDANNSGTLTQLSSATISNAHSGLANYTVTYTSTGSEAGDGFPVVAYHVPAQGSSGGMWVDDYTITMATAALITSQPASVTNVDGTATSFTVTAQGATLSYQWQASNGVGGYTNLVNGAGFSGATSNVLSIASATSSTPASYQVVISNYFGSVTSTVATLSLTPHISTQPPALQATTVGGSTSLSVTADGSPTVTYQWQATNSATGGFTNVPNTAPFSGATSSTLSVTGATANQALTYQVVVANSYGSVTSTPSVLTVSSAPVITVQPLSQTNNAGTTVSFTVTATGTAPLAYQWQASNGVGGYTNLSSTGSFSGANTNTLTITSIADANALSYQVIITNSSGAVTSSPASLTVIDPPVIGSSPASQSVNVGSTVNFTVTTASGTAPFTYQWQTNGVTVGNGGIVSGATTSTLTLTGVTTNYALNYTVVVTNPAGSVTSSPAATLAVHVPASIVTQPVSAYASPGATATFSVVAAGDPTLSYQWQSGPVGGPFTNVVNVGQYSGATSSTLTITNANTPVAISYQVIVTNNYGSVTSSVASLTLGTLVDVQFLGQSPSSSGAPGAYGVGSAYSGAAIFGSAGDTWNQEAYPYYNQNNPAFNGVSLVNAANVASGLTLTVAGDGSNPVQGAGLNGTVTDAATTNLMSAAFWQFGINGAGAYNSTFTIAGLSAYAGDNVQLVVLAGAPSAQTEQIALTGGVNGYSPSGTQTTTSTSRQLSAGAGVAYQIFTNGVLTGGNLTFTLNETGAGNYNNAAYINGIQLLIQYPDPAITNQPVSQTKVAGSTATFSVGATGSATLSYQWQATNSASGGFTNLTDIPGVISGSQSNLLTFTGVTANESLTYQVVVSNGSGSVTSTPASLNVLTIPIITTNPASQTVLNGSTVTFTVGATGIGTLSYQWQTNGVNVTDGGIISGSATSTLTLAGVTTNNAISYQVVVTNVNGSVTSSPASLTVLPTTELIDVDIGTGSGTQTGAAILGQSGDVWNVVSQGTITTVVDSGSNTLSGVTIGDSAAGSYATPSPAVDAATAALMSDFNYNTPGSGPVPVTITGLGVYTNSAFTLVAYAGMDPGQACTINITTGATGGNTAGTLATTSATRKLSDGIGVAYNEFTGTLTNGTLTFTVSGASFHGPNGFQLLLSPTVPPVITTNPVASTTNYTGTTATFSVGAVTATGSLTYQWQANGTNLTDGGIVSGSATSTLTLTGVTTNSALPYQVIVSNGSGSVTSRVANLTVFTVPVAGTNFTLGVTLGVPSTVKIIGGKYTPTDANGFPLSITSVTGATNGTVSTDGTNITYTATNTAVGATNDSFNYTVSDGYSGTATQTVSVTIDTSSAAAQGFNKIGTPQLIGGYEVMTYAGIPGFNYALDWTTNLTPPIVWTPIMTNPASANGSIILSNTPSGGSDFYRTRYVP
jgi:hypothetical protein